MIVQDSAGAAALDTFISECVAGNVVNNEFINRFNPNHHHSTFAHCDLRLKDALVRFCHEAQALVLAANRSIRLQRTGSPDRISTALVEENTETLPASTAPNPTETYEISARQSLERPSKRNKVCISDAHRNDTAQSDRQTRSTTTDRRSDDTASGLITTTNTGTSARFDSRVENGVLVIQSSVKSLSGDFDELLKFAVQRGAEEVGAFKIRLSGEGDLFTPNSKPFKAEVSSFTPEKRPDRTFYVARSRTEGTMNVGRMLQEEKRSAGAGGVVGSASEGGDEERTADSISKFESLLLQVRGSPGLKKVSYCTGLDARTPQDRASYGLPTESPLASLSGNCLGNTRYRIPGFHWPYAYIASNSFGAPFLCHKDNFDLVAANVLYVGRKIWTVIPPHQASRLENQTLTNPEWLCAQRVSHQSLYLPQGLLRSWDLSFRNICQQANEVMVVLPNAYHQGFSEGVTVAEAINYAPQGWSVGEYSDCNPGCPGNPVANAQMKFREEGEEQMEEDIDSLGQSESSDAETEEISAPVNTSAKKSLSRKDRAGALTTSSGKTGPAREDTQDHITPRHKAKRIALDSNSNQVQTPGNSQLLSKRKAEDAFTSPTGPFVSRAFWKAWDDCQETQLGIVQDVKAEEVYQWFTTSGRPWLKEKDREQKPKHLEARIDDMVQMVLAIASPSGVRALKNALQPDKSTAGTNGLWSQDISSVYWALEHIDKQLGLNCYRRRLGLAHLAHLYETALANGGQLEPSQNNKRALRERKPNKKDKDLTMKAMIKAIWGVSFPAGEANRRLSRHGMVAADTPEAREWNSCKTTLLGRINTGKRWKNLCDSFGKASIVLIAPNWLIDGATRTMTDTTFERLLTKDEYNGVSNAIKQFKGRSLADYDTYFTTTVDADFWTVVKSPERSLAFPLLQIEQDSSLFPDSGDEWDASDSE